MSDEIPAARLVAEIGVDGEEAGSAALTRFGAKVDETSAKQAAGFGRVGVAAKAADSQLASFGIPFAGTAGRVINSIEGIEVRSKSLGSTLSNLGQAEATAAVVGLAAVATEGVHLADSLETAHARLEVATKNAGEQWDQYSGQVAATDKAMEKLGFTNADTEASLARLETATHSLGKSQQDEKIVADVSAGAHKDLATATTLLVQVEGGRYTQLSRLLGVSKETIASFHSSADAVSYLANAYRGQGAAAADTFAGKQKILSAELQDLGAVAGEWVVPKLLTLADTTVGAVQGFERFNASTHGLTGDLLLATAALPLAAFAMDKVSGATIAVGSALDRAGTLAASASARVVAASAAEDAAITAANGARLQAITTDQELAASESEVAVASQGAASAQTLAGAATIGARGGFAALGAILPWVAGGLAAVHFGGTALASAFRSGAGATDELVTSLKRLADTGATNAALVQKYGANYKQLASDINQIHFDSTGISRVTLDVGHFLGLSTDAENRVKSLSDSLKKLYQTDPSAALNAFQNIKAHLEADGESAGRVDTIFKGLEKTIGGLSGPVDQTTLAQTRLNDATARYSDDIIAKRPASILTADYGKVKDAAVVLYGAQNQVTAATDAGAQAAFGAADAINSSADAATSGAFAYLGLASSVKTAADALAAIEAGATTAASSPYQLQLDTSAAQASADALHGKIDAATSGGGGGGGGGKAAQTATAQALDHAQKELALRDAMVGVKTATQGEESAQLQLVQARQADGAAVVTLDAAEKNYRDTLHGVAADTRQAQDALDALTSARASAAEQQLNVGDAERNLAKARNDSQLNGFGVTDAEATLAAARTPALAANQAVADAETNLVNVRQSGTATADDIAAAEQAVTDARTAAAPLNEQVTKDEVALADARIDATKGDEDIRRAEIRLTQARLDAKAKTTDLNVAQRTYNDTLHGYPPKSAEAKAATLALKDAQIQARGAADQVASATLGIVSAENQIPTAALAVQRATADLDGKLTASAGADGGMGKLQTTAGNLITKLDDLRQKTIAVANDMAAAATAAGLRVGQGIQQATAEGLLANIEAMQAATAAEPLLAGAFDTVIARYKAVVGQIDAQVLQKEAGTLGSITGRGSFAATPTHATGGTIGPDEYGIVGDINGQGGELVKGLATGGAQVYTHNESVNLLAGAAAPKIDLRPLEQKLDQLAGVVKAQPAVQVNVTNQIDVGALTNKLDLTPGRRQPELAAGPLLVHLDNVAARPVGDPRASTDLTPLMKKLDELIAIVKRQRPPTSLHVENANGTPEQLAHALAMQQQRAHMLSTLS